jgi:hypothetical protein
MYVGVIHTVKDMEAMYSRGEAFGDPGNAPAGTRPILFFPSVDGSAATCLWETNSVEDVQNYTDTTLGDCSEQIVFEISSEHAIGLPESAVSQA